MDGCMLWGDFRARTSSTASSTWTRPRGSGPTSPQSRRGCLSRRISLASGAGTGLEPQGTKIVVLMVMITLLVCPMVMWQKMGVMGCLMDTCQELQPVSEVSEGKKGGYKSLLPTVGKLVYHERFPGLITFSYISTSMYSHLEETSLSFLSV